MLRKLWQDQNGVIISAELVLVLTIAVLAMIVGLSEVAVAVNEELNDISNAVGRLNQSYSYTGFIGEDGKTKSEYSGGSYYDKMEDCDCNRSVISCDMSSEKGGHYYYY